MMKEQFGVVTENNKLAEDQKGRCVSAVFSW